MRYAALLGALLFSGASTARAADTVEPFEAGAVNLESYIALDSVNRGSAHRAMGSELLLGYGLTSGLSAWLGAAFESSVAGDNLTTGEVALGLIAAAVDTDHLDLDLTLGLGAGAPALRRLAITPGLELNLDRRPELQSYGLYLRGGLPVEASFEEPGGALELHLAATVGAYVTLVGEHQLLVEYENPIRLRPRAEEHVLGAGRVSLGYNVALNEVFELVSGVGLSLPEEGAPLSVGLVTGLILSLP